MMRKSMIAIVAALLVCATAVDSQAVNNNRGGFMGFIAGCCFGIRAGADYNDGKEIHWREWCRIIPYAGIIFAIWDGVDGASGMTRADYQGKYGSAFY